MFDFFGKDTFCLGIATFGAIVGLFVHAYKKVFSRKKRLRFNQNLRNFVQVLKNMNLTNLIEKGFSLVDKIFERRYPYKIEPKNSIILSCNILFAIDSLFISSITYIISILFIINFNRNLLFCLSEPLMLLTYSIGLYKQYYNGEKTISVKKIFFTVLIVSAIDILAYVVFSNLFLANKISNIYLYKFLQVIIIMQMYFKFIRTYDYFRFTCRDFKRFVKGKKICVCF